MSFNIESMSESMSVNIVNVRVNIINVRVNVIKYTANVRVNIKINIESIS